VIATRLGLKLADVVVTEAGFGADLGAEKFIDIKCRSAGLKPSCAVVVATVRALKMHGGVAKGDLGAENVEALKAGLPNLLRHVENMQKFGLPVVVAINRFTSDTPAERAAISQAVSALGVAVQDCNHWAEGGHGAESLARAVLDLAESGKARFEPLYPDELPLADKMRVIAREIYRASDIALDPAAVTKLRQIEAEGYGTLPVCMAKTQYSFSADPNKRGAPEGFTVPIRDVRLCAPEFVVALCGDILTMPGLPSKPAADGIHVDDAGNIEGLF
jgi:formate--tetrahydrofolate ligase